MVDQLNRFASEVTRVAREVGTEGRLGGQANVPGVAGTWKDLTDSVNSMAGNLTAQVRNIAEVTTAVAQGDLSRKITVDVKGEFLELKKTFNTMVDQLNAFASEVTRVAREVGTEGKLGGQAQVPDVAGTWKDLTDNVNFMASNLTAQVRNIAEVATAIAEGDLSKKITVDVRGEILLLKDTVNTMVEQLRSFAAEVTRVAREVGTGGRLGGQAVVPGVGGTWKDLTENVNLLAANLTTQVRNIAEVTTAVALGDLSRKITVDAKGEILELKNTINTMVDQLNGFASEVTRVAREVGTEGRLGGQAIVPGVAGTWKALTDTVNDMAANLTEQVRGIVGVVTSVATGDLTKNLEVQAKGEVAALAETINNMTRTLAIFADQVTSVAREVGVEGRLGGQANVPGADGTWKDLTGNVNLLAANLTTQVRAIAEVATAVTKGDLTRSIQVDARGEVAELKDNINTMIGNLRVTTERNTEQDWLKTNLAKVTGLLQGQRNLEIVGGILLSELVPLVSAQSGAIYRVHDNAEDELILLSVYADDPSRGYGQKIAAGQGLIGQSFRDKRRILVTRIPKDAVPIGSALFRARPRNIIILPVLFETRVKAVMELSSLGSFTELQLAFLEQLTASIGIVFNSIEASMQTEALLTQSQQLAAELQSQQTELQQTNEQLAQKAQQIAERNFEVERKNEEIEQARRELEEKARELALTSKYKSDFLANMSHELRTPLNSILILGQQLAENHDRNLSSRQIEFARTIHAAGTDLLNLISDILDLSKIESGTVSVDAELIDLGRLVDVVERPFRHESEQRKLSFVVEVDPALGNSISTDAKRLQQVLKNLLSNAFKFTREGEIRLTVSRVGRGWSPQSATLNAARAVVAFEVSDTGIGIPEDKQRIVFEAFQQADASTSRKFGGTGLGLAISRELAALLGGEIQLRSTPAAGSTFTLYLPQFFNESPAAAKVAEDTRAALPAIPRFKMAAAADDRDSINPGDAVVLVIEDDPASLEQLAKACHELGHKVVSSQSGGNAAELAERYRPIAIVLDVFLPDMLGWSILAELKRNLSTRHIPVEIMSADDGAAQALASGAYGHIQKPIQPAALRDSLASLIAFARETRKRLLVVEDNEGDLQAVMALLAGDDVEISAALSGSEAMEKLEKEPFQCVVLDLKLPDITGFELLEKIAATPHLRPVPVVVHTGRDLSRDDELRLKQLARTIVIKDVESRERLVYQTALHLHRDFAGMPPAMQSMLAELDTYATDFAGRTALIVDDDPRNIFALSGVLEGRGLHVISATTGREALDIVAGTPNISIILMDIMMPEMDGYQTIAAIREKPGLGRLPIIALTAKAMKGDREKCLEAGASDYLAKPVNTDRLLETLGLWLHR